MTKRKSCVSGLIVASLSLTLTSGCVKTGGYPTTSEEKRVGCQALFEDGRAFAEEIQNGVDRPELIHRGTRLLETVMIYCDD